jgi:hypothetical protein
MRKIFDHNSDGVSHYSDQGTFGDEWEDNTDDFGPPGFQNQNQNGNNNNNQGETDKV